VPEYAIPTAPFGNEEFDTVSGVRIVRFRLFRAVFAGTAASATCTVIGNDPPTVGVPEIAPVEVLNTRPEGSVPLVIVQE